MTEPTGSCAATSTACPSSSPCWTRTGARSARVNPARDPRPEADHPCRSLLSPTSTSAPARTTTTCRPRRILMTNLEFHTPYRRDGRGRHSVEWPEGWPIPRVGDGVYTADGYPLTVWAVDWYPHGVAGSEPFVYVVLRELR